MPTAIAENTWITLRRGPAAGRYGAPSSAPCQSIEISGITPMPLKNNKRLLGWVVQLTTSDAAAPSRKQRARPSVRNSGQSENSATAHTNTAIRNSGRWPQLGPNIEASAGGSSS